MPSIAMVGLPSQKHYLHGTWKCLLAEITVAKFPNRILVYGVEGGSPVFFETLMDVVPKYTRQVNNRDISIAVLRTFIKKRKEDHEAFVSRNAKGGPKTSEKKSPASGSEEAPAKSEVNNVNGIHDGNSAEPLADEACDATPEEPKNTTKVKDQRELKPIRVLEELKGNIRVFCRVRPLLPKEGSNTKTIAFPTSTEAMGRGVELWQNGQKHPFMFDKVFVSDTAQQDVFVEISQLVQSALDGYKVCIFAYGQTGSGKTFTMMGKPGFSEMKGLIPRSLEQIFATRQSLQSQGWKYELQVLMLEIYNKTIHDLLSTSKSGVTETTSGKQYTIKHDVNGNTHVSDLTIVDVNSSKEVAYLLDKAAQSRFVGKILMNEQSELEEELLVYFIEQEMKECFASCLFACYDLIRADVVLEVAWLNNMIDFAFPYLLQFIR